MDKLIAQYYERYGRWLPAAAATLFAVVLGMQLAKLAWALVPVPEAGRWTPPPVAPPQTAPQQQTGDLLRTIMAANLFGVKPAEDAPLPNEPIRETPLNLTLIGILASTPDRDSRALIAEASGKQDTYAVGDDVARGTSLEAIFADHVILMRNNKREILRLDKDKPASGGGTYTPPQPYNGDDEEDYGNDVMPEEEYQEEPLARIREEVLSDPGKAQQFIRVVPANVSGQQRGYRIYPGRDRALFTAAGLRPGDLVTAVNGVELTDPARALQLLGDLTQASSVNLTVERGGQVQNITVSVN